MTKQRASYIRGDVHGFRIFLTSKPDKANHGFGLRNIDDVIKKYGGIKKISVDIDVFTMMIMIPIP